MFEENIAFSCGVILDHTLVLSPQILNLGAPRVNKSHYNRNSYIQ